MNRRIVICFLVAGLAWVLLNAHAWADNQPVGTTFTYQGRLMQDGEPAVGEIDLVFRLYGSQSGSDQIGPELTAAGTEIEDGLFTIDLDFGTSVFTGEERWLEVEVNDTVLSPRQPIMPTPYAMVATTAANVPTKAVVGSYSGIIGVGTLDNLNVAGNVGIGTANPQTPLEVAGTIRSSGPDGGVFQARNPNNQSANVSLSWLDDVPRLRIGGNGPGANGGFDIQRIGNQSLFRVHGDGNVGIGTADPSRSLHVRKSNPSILIESTSGASTYLRFRRGGVDEDDNQNYMALSSSNGSLVTRVGGMDRMRIMADGDIGIGTNSPEGKLHVVGEDSNIAARLVGSDQFGIGVHSHGGQIGVWGQSPTTGIVGYASDNAPTSETIAVSGFNTADSGPGHGVRGSTGSGAGHGVWTGHGGMTPSGGGSALFAEVSQEGSTVPAIRATAPYYPVVVTATDSGVAINATVEGDAGVGVFSSVKSNTALLGTVTGDSGSGFAVRGSVQNSNHYASHFTGGRNFFGGWVGIGTDNPQFQLHLTQNNAAKPTSNVWTVTSDRRLKTNIRTIEHSLDDLLALRGVTYQWINPETQGGMDGVYTGFIAQEVEEVFPEWVDVDPDGWKNVTVIGFEGLVVEALRELRAEKDAEIDMLRAEKNAEIAVLNARLADLENVVAELLAAEKGDTP